VAGEDAAVIGKDGRSGKRSITMDESTALSVQKKLVEEYTELTSQASAIKHNF
jgi:hypothetical protein